MPGKGITLFRLFGFAVRVDASWLLLAALITWTLAVGYFPYRVRGLPVADYWWMGFASAVALFGSIVVHELSHSLVARHYNLQMNGITLFIFGGVAEMSEEPRDAKTEFLMAIAGPITSVVIGCVLYAVYAAGKAAWPVQVALVIGYLAWLNLVLAAFNLVPAFPLDGGRVLRSALWYWRGNLARATRVASSIGSGFGILLMLLAVWQLFTGNFVGAVWWFLIGMFLRNAATSSYRQMMLRQALEGEPVRRLMTSEPVTVTPDTSIEHLVEDYIYKRHHKMFPVVSEGSETLAGCVTSSDVKRIPRREWPAHRVAEVLHPCSEENTVSADTDAVNALSKIARSGLNRLMVVDHEHLVGVISAKDLMAFLAAKLDLEGDFPHSAPAR